MDSQTYKKLDSGSPSGGLIEKGNLYSILGKGFDLDDLSALVTAGYVRYDNIPMPDESMLSGRYDQEFVADTDVELVTGWWSNAWKIADRTMSAAEEASAKVRAYSDIRRQRDLLLSTTDFYGNSDITMPDNIKTYRQALRDLPANTADPYNVTWPTDPRGDTWNT